MVCHTILILCFFLLYFCQLYNCETLPHTSCKYSPQSPYSPPNLQCTESNLTIPSTFAYENIPEDIEFLWLNCPSSRDYTYCNVIEPNIQPFPALDKLITIDLWGFASQNGERFPLNVLLKNVRHQVRGMDIRYSKIGYLDAEYFTGFSALQTLVLEHNDIADIAVDTFQSLSQSRPVLTAISLVGNQVASLDWAVLEPVADTLTAMHLSKQTPGLHSLYRSKPSFYLKKLETLALHNNSLKSIPKVVLDTMTFFANNSYNMYDLRYNPFCELVSDCSCHEMKDFLQWIEIIRQSSTEGQVFVFDYHCGNETKAVHQMIKHAQLQLAGTEEDSGKLQHTE